jgi:hypothetical protein
VLLTETEERQLGKDLARARHLLGASTDARAEAVSQFKAEIEKMEAEMNRLAALINNGYEYREVECEVISNYRDGQITVLRVDTGEEVEARAMNGAEQQMGLPLADGGDSPYPGL